MKILACLVPVFALPFCASAGLLSFTDNFANGINPTNWAVITNDGSFSVYVPTPNDVSIFKPAGTNQGFHFAILACHVAAVGDFSAQITFTNANIQLGPGANADQLQFDCRFGGQDFLVVRSDEASLGQNAHVYMNPPGNQLFGATGTTATSGMLMVTRTGTLVSGYFNSTLLYQGNFNTNDATFAFCIQNNQTDDAMSASFGNFQLSAVGFTNTPPNLQVQLRNSSCIVSWPNLAWADYLSPNNLESTTNLDGKSAVVTNIVSSSTGMYWFTNSATGPDKFYRLRMGP